ncbi:MAG: hypothetical protein Q7S11_02230 [bacterium]|nr:hypothetical protein [bacterium]
MFLLPPLLFFTLLVLVALIITTIFFFLFSVRDKIIIDVPFVPVRKRAVIQIVNALHLSQGSILYDLGCGDGRVLIEAVRRTSEISGVGIENGIIPFLVATMRTRKLSIGIHYENIFDANITQATHLFCYLSPQVLKKLAPKILRECRAGTQIVSCDYKFPNWIPIDTISIATKDDQLARMLYVYVI